MDTAVSGPASLLYSTYYGFDLNETGNSIAVDSQGSAYVLCGLAARITVTRQGDISAPASVEYPTLDGEASAGVTPTDEEKQAAAAAYGGSGSTGRVAALRSVTDSASVRAAERETAFVLLQYLGYLRRDPDQRGYDFWLTKLVKQNGNFVSAEMVKAFNTSAEYRQRFSR